jgi:sugar phosphate isomerase/epimerase
VHVGIKLDVGFAESGAYRQLYGDRDILGYLRGMGVRAVEAPIGADTGDRAVRDYVQRCGDAGLRVSFHPYTEMTPSNPAFFSWDGDNPCRLLHERFLNIAAQAAHLQPDPTIVNIHAAAAPRECSREALIDQSVRFFEWARQWCEANAPSVRPVVELQIRPETQEDIQRIGDNYAELLDIVERSGVDACWDFGHAFMNHRRFGLPLEPPPELRPRIAHVHCHDVYRGDHQPLLFGNVPWERFLRSLGVANLDGAVILEIPPQHFLSAGGIDAVRHSVRVVAECIKAASGTQ